MAALMNKSVRSGMILLAACAVLGLAGCETTGKTGQTSAFDVSKASPDNIKKALDSSTEHASASQGQPFQHVSLSC